MSDFFTIGWFGKIMAAPISRIIQHQSLPTLFSRDFFPLNKNCLEIGCGRGYSFKIIQNYFYPKKLIAIDIDDKAIDKAQREIKRKGLKNFIVQKADANHLPFPDNFFEIVFIFAVLHHTQNWKQVLREAKRVLAPNGHLILKEPTQRAYQIPIVGFFYKKADRPLSLFSEKELRKELGQDNFKIFSWKHRGFFSIEGVCQK